MGSQGHIKYDWLIHPEPNWLGNYSAIQRTYLAPEYLRDTALHNVIGTVAIEAECDRSQQVAETKWFSEVSDHYGLPSVIVAHAWVDTPNAEEILAQQVQYKRVRGIRTKPIIAATPTDSVREDNLAACRIRNGLKVWPYLKNTTYPGICDYLGGT